MRATRATPPSPRPARHPSREERALEIAEAIQIAGDHGTSAGLNNSRFQHSSR